MKQIPLLKVRTLSIPEVYALPEVCFAPLVPRLNGTVLNLDTSVVYQNSPHSATCFFSFEHIFTLLAPAHKDCKKSLLRIYQPEGIVAPIAKQLTTSVFLIFRPTPESPFMQLPKSLTARTFAVIALSVAIYAAVALYVGWDDLRAEFGKFPPRLLLPLAALSLANYGLRYWRWEVYLRALKVQLPFRESIGLYFATYLMVITPGKIGEVFKAGILRERHGVSLSLGLPVVLAERIYDFLAVLILAVIGVFFWPGSLTGLTTGLLAAACIPLLLVLFQARPVRTRLVNKVAGSPLLSRHQVGIDEASEALSHLLGYRLATYSLLVSVIAWSAECLGLWLVCGGLDFALPVGQSFFVYAAGTIVGSLSFLPGGLGGTEATIIWLLETLDMSRTSAATAALLVRLFTLWLAVLVGLFSFLVFRRYLRPSPAKETRLAEPPHRG